MDINDVERNEAFFELQPKIDGLVDQLLISRGIHGIDGHTSLNEAYRELRDSARAVTPNLIYWDAMTFALETYVSSVLAALPDKGVHSSKALTHKPAVPGH